MRSCFFALKERRWLSCQRTISSQVSAFHTIRSWSLNSRIDGPLWANSLVGIIVTSYWRVLSKGNNATSSSTATLTTTATSSTTSSSTTSSTATSSTTELSITVTVTILSTRATVLPITQHHHQIITVSSTINNRNVVINILHCG